VEDDPLLGQKVEKKKNESAKEKRGALSGRDPTAPSHNTEEKKLYIRPGRTFAAEKGTCKNLQKSSRHHPAACRIRKKDAARPQNGEEHVRKTKPKDAPGRVPLVVILASGRT